MYKEVGLLELSERRSNLHKLYQFFKMQNGLTALYLTNILQPRTVEVKNLRIPYVMLTVIDKLLRAHKCMLVLFSRQLYLHEILFQLQLRPRTL